MLSDAASGNAAASTKRRWYMVAFNIGYVKTMAMMTTSAAELSLFESTQPK